VHQPSLFEGWNILALALSDAVQQLLYRLLLLLLLLPACLPAHFTLAREETRL